MEAKKTMTIRPGNEYAGIIEKLETAAKKKKWSLNKFVLIKLSEIVKKNGN